MDSTEDVPLSFGVTVRGKGKIFTQLLGIGPGTSQLTAESRSVNGDALPAKIVPLEGGDEMVLVLPVLDVSQTVSISSGDKLLISKVFKPMAAKMRSRLNTFTQNEDAERIRNIDYPALPGEPVIDVGMTLPNRDGSETFRVYIDFRDIRESESKAPVTLQVLGGDGKSLLQGDRIILADATKPDRYYPEALTRRVAFSIRIPRSAPTAIFWVSSEVRGFQDNFLCFESFRMREHRNFWREVTVAADEYPEYEKWYLEKHRATAVDLQIQRNAAFSIHPLFSIIVPLYKTPKVLLQEMIESVLAQTYGRFELVLVNASPEDAEVGDIVRGFMERDERIHVVSLDKNRGITENTNEGIKRAAGDFLCFLDHDDVLEPDALYCYARGIEHYPETDLLYSDEDKLRDGHYCSPFFKPDWNPDLLCSENYVCHFLAVRTSVLAKMELPTSEYDGAQDHHMTLRIGERARNVFHARRVLYHWRIHEGSTAASGAAKSYTMDAGVRAVQSHLDRCGIKATASKSELVPNQYHVDYELDGHPLVSIIIPNKDASDLLERCVDSILQKSTYKHFEIIIVENNSVEPETEALYKKLVASNECIRVVRYEGGFNFSKIVNFGFSYASGDYVLMLNNDTELITASWLERMLGICQRPEVGAVGVQLLYPDGALQHAGVTFDTTGPFHTCIGLPSDSLAYYGMNLLTQDVSAVTGACLLTKRELFELVDGLDERFEVDFNDIDFCLKLRERGLLVVYEPTVQLIHYESVSRGGHEDFGKKERFIREISLMQTRWSRYYISGDPYGSPSFAPSNRYRQLYLQKGRGSQSWE